MRRTSLPVLGSQGDNVGQRGIPASDGKLAVDLGVLSVHFDGGRCHVRCPFCYLGEREGTAQSGVPVDLLSETLALLPYQELAIALSEPIGPALGPLAALTAVAQQRGKRVTITTTVAAALALPETAWQSIGRLNLSVDPQKGQWQAPVGQVVPSDLAGALRLLPKSVEKVLIVTLAETTPVLEATGLQQDLRRAGIEPWAWVVNNSVAATQISSPLLLQRASNERGEIEQVATRHATRFAVVPLLQHEPVGVQRLQQLARCQTEAQ